MEKNKKSISFVSPYGYPLLTIHKEKGAGGAERQFFLFGTNLAKAGWNVSFITERPKVNQIEKKHILPVNFASFSYLGGNKLNTFFDWISLFLAMKKTRSHYYAIKTPGHLLFPMKLFCKILRSKLIFWAQMEYDAYPEKRPIPKFPGLLQDIGTRLSDIIIGQNAHQVSGFKSNYNRKAYYIRNIIGNLTSCKTAESNATNTTDVLWVGNSLPKKQYEVVVSLASKMPDIKFTVAMNIADPIRYKQAEKNFQKMDNVNFLGSVPSDDMENWYSKTKIFLNTSSQEGFPNTFLQAWQNRVPVISLQVDPDSLIKKYQLGYAREEKNTVKNEKDFDTHANLLEPLISKLIYDTKLRNQMGMNAKKYVEKHHSAKAVIPQLIEILNRTEDH